MERAEKIKIINNYCKPRTCSNCRIKKLRRCEEPFSEYDLQEQEYEHVLDKCLELIGKSIYEHDGCCGCKHEPKAEKDEPCKKCRLSKEFRSDEYYRSRDLYEPAERVESTDNVPQIVMDYLENFKEQLEKINNSPVQILTPDNVNHPAHYADSCSLECIQVMRLMLGNEAVVHFCLCNAFKYLWRYKHKNGDEDLRKAEWYLNEAEYCGFEHTSQQDFCNRINNLLKELKNE